MSGRLLVSVFEREDDVVQATIAARKESLSIDEMQERMAAMNAQRQPRESPAFIPKGFRTVIEIEGDSR